MEGYNMLATLYVKFWQFRHDRSGVTAVEYGVIAAAVVVGIVVVVFSLGDKIEASFRTLNETLPSSAP
jgi:Flp pilus assembly pilin Flp